MVSVKSVNLATDMGTINEILEQEGCIVIKDILSKDQLNLLKSEMEQEFNKTDNCSGDFYGYVTKRFSGLLAKSVASREMTVHPSILQIMDEFLLRGCSEYQLNLTQAIRIGPGEPQQIIHRDEVMFHYDHPKSEAMINCMWAVDDFTAENGATNLVPGSHKWDRERVPLPEEITQGVMTAGSVLIYFGGLAHGGGANTTQKPRAGLVLSYCHGWLRQAENQYLAVSRDLTASFPECLQRLMGYFVHKPNLGCVEGQDPIALLKGSAEKPVFTEFLPDEVKPMLKEYRDALTKVAA